MSARKASTCALCGKNATCVVAIRSRSQGQRLRVTSSVYACADHGRVVADKAKAAGKSPKVNKLKFQPVNEY